MFQILNKKYYLSWYLWSPLIILLGVLPLYFSSVSIRDVYFWFDQAMANPNYKINTPDFVEYFLSMNSVLVVILPVLLVWIGIKNYKRRRSYMKNSEAL